MKVRTNFFERILLRLAYIMTEWSYNITWHIYCKYDPKREFDYHSFTKKFVEILFSKKDEEKP